MQVLDYLPAILAFLFTLLGVMTKTNDACCRGSAVLSEPLSRCTTTTTSLPTYMQGTETRWFGSQLGKSASSRASFRAGQEVWSESGWKCSPVNCGKTSSRPSRGSR